MNPRKTEYAFCGTCGRVTRIKKGPHTIGLGLCAAVLLFFLYSGAYLYEYGALFAAFVICAAGSRTRKCFICGGTDLSPYEDPFEENEDGKENK